MKKLLFRGFIRHYVGIIFQKSVKNDDGTLKLKRAAITRIGPLVGLLIAISAFILGYYNDPSMSSEDSLLFLQVMGVCSALLGLMTLVLSVSKTIAGQDGISTYRLFVKRHISYEEIHQVTFTRLFGGCMELTGQGKKIRIPLDTRGFAEFYEMLKQQKPQLEFYAIEHELQKRTQLLESVGYRFS